MSQINMISQNKKPMVINLPPSVYIKQMRLTESPFLGLTSSADTHSDRRCRSSHQQH